MSPDFFRTSTDDPADAASSIANSKMPRSSRRGGLSSASERLLAKQPKGLEDQDRTKEGDAVEDRLPKATGCLPALKRNIFGLRRTLQPADGINRLEYQGRRFGIILNTKGY